MRLCRDCRFLRWEPVPIKLRRCRNPKTFGFPDPVTGKRHVYFATTLRSVGGCSGQFFEPKQSVWAWLKGWFATWFATPTA